MGRFSSSIGYRKGCRSEITSYRLRRPQEAQAQRNGIDSSGQRGGAMAEKMMELSAKSKPASGLPFPDRYASTATSGLAFTVQPGANTFELSLKK